MMRVLANSHRCLTPPGAATGGAQRLAVFIPHSRAAYTGCLRDRRPACRWRASVVRSVAVHFIRIKPAQYLPHKRVEPAESHLQVPSSAVGGYVPKRSEHGARKNGFVTQQGSR